MQNLASLILQMERIEAEINARLFRLKDDFVKGEAGNGLVIVTSDILCNIKDLHIDKRRVQETGCDLTTLETLIKEAVNRTMKNARNVLKQEMEHIMGDKIPPELSDFLG